MRWLDRGFEDYDALWRWSVEDLEGFWGSIAAFFDVRWHAPPRTVLESRRMPGAVWFPGARLSYVEHVFRDRDPDAVALQHATESRGPEHWTWGRLEAQTRRIAAGLRRLGVREGDRVVAWMPNVPETLAAFLATSWLGAVWSSAAPEFGARAVVDRFAQLEPRVMLTVDGYAYGGRTFDLGTATAAVAQELPTLEHVVRFGNLDGSGWPDGLLVDEPLPFASLPFDHPLWVLFSSGTTGLPKGIVHGQGAMLLEQLKTVHLHLDAQPEDRVFWFTTTGWMMWNLLAGVLLSDAQVVLYDGNPAHPDLGALWDLAERTGITTFGTSAAYLSTCMKAGLDPASGRELAIRAVGSTGSPLAPEGFDWVYETLGPDLWLFSTSGGTDLCTAFVGGCPLKPVHRGELQARALGAKVEAWDEEGRSLVGQVGELVITAPMPTMPLRLVGDPDGERLRDSYFSTYPGVWRHGDWIEITERGTAIISGRSDSTINRGGIRMGTSEIYRAVLAVEEVLDALVVDVPRPGRESWMALFVVLPPGRELDEELVGRVRRQVRQDCSPRHVPDDVLAVRAVPRTLSGKLLEVPVKRILSGAAAADVASRDSLADPEALDWFERFARERERSAAG